MTPVDLERLADLVAERLVSELAPLTAARCLMLRRLLGASGWSATTCTGTHDGSERAASATVARHGCGSCGRTFWLRFHAPQARGHR